MSNSEVLERLFNLTNILYQEQDPDRLLEIIMDQIIVISGAERGFLIFCEGDDIKVMLSRNINNKDAEDIRMKFSSTILEKTIRYGKPLVFADAIRDEELSRIESVQRLGIRSVCAIPLQFGGRTIAVIYLDDTKKTGIFDKKKLEALSAFAGQAALALRNAQMFDQIKRLNERLNEKVILQQKEIEHMRTQIQRQTEPIIGKSKAIRDILRIIEKVSKVNYPVFIHGESGTGKELIAREIHNKGRRRDGPFIVANCGAIPDSLMESELFGHTKGAFSGALKEKPGLFELANNGTLFLDEIENMSDDMQEALLRVIETGEIRRVGAKYVTKVDSRIISASNEDIENLTDQGLFRKDLYFRLNVISIYVPPLRERKEDLLPLINYFLAKTAKETGRSTKRLSPKAFEHLMEYPWPGNVRELENAIRHAYVLSDSKLLDIGDFAFLIKKEKSKEVTTPLVSVDDYINSMIKQHTHDLGIKELAERLGISRKTIWERKRRLGL